MSSNLFNRNIIRARRERASGSYSDYAFLHDYMAQSVAESVSFLKAMPQTLLDVGARSGAIGQHLAEKPEILVEMAVSCLLLTQSTGILKVVADDGLLPFAGNTFEAVVSAAALHVVDDLPGVLAQIFHILKPHGLFIACIFGGETLRELKRSLAVAEEELYRGISPRVMPFVEMRSGVALLQRAGFSEAVADTEIITVTYDNAFALMRDLRGMGESNPLRERKSGLHRPEFFARAAEVYAELFTGVDGRITATFELLTLTGWKAKKRSPE